MNGKSSPLRQHFASDWWRCMWKSRQFMKSLWHNFLHALLTGNFLLPKIYKFGRFSLCSTWIANTGKLSLSRIFTIMVEAINCARSKSSEDISLLSYEIIHWISPSHISIGPGHFHPRTHMVEKLFYARKYRSLLWGDKNTCTRPHKACSVLLNGFTKQLQFIAFHQHRLALYPFPRDVDRKDELTSDSIHSNKYQENFTVKHPQEIHFKTHFFVVERSREKNP